MSTGEASQLETKDVGGSLLRQTLMNVDECFVYKLPPLTSSGGHRAEQWNLAKPLQTCGFQVERRNNDLYLLFTTENHTKLFALAKLHEENASKSVESVVDSSRYFVVQVQAAGKSAYIGFGFRDRDVAIDLLGNLQQFQNSIRREMQAKNMKVAEIPKLAEGEKMHISIGNITSTRKKTSSASKPSGGGGPFLLKKPPQVETTAEGTVNTTPEEVTKKLEELQVVSETPEVSAPEEDEEEEENFEDDDWGDFEEAK